jgi:hypothetical protein
LSLRCGVATPCIAFIAVSEERRTDGTAPVKVQQPVAVRISAGRGDAVANGPRLIASSNSMPVEASVDAHASQAALQPILHDIGLRKDPLSWSEDRQGRRIGRAWIVTLADSLTGWSIDP